MPEPSSISGSTDEFPAVRPEPQSPPAGAQSDDAQAYEAEYGDAEHDDARVYDARVYDAQVYDAPVYEAPVYEAQAYDTEPVDERPTAQPWVAAHGSAGRQRSGSRGAAWAETATAALAVVGSTAAKAGRGLRRQPVAWTQVGGGLLAALGALLPWITFSVDGTSWSRGGFDYGADGLVVLVLGLVVAGLAVFAALGLRVPGANALPKGTPVFLSAALLLVGGLAWIEVVSTGPEEFDLPVRFAAALGFDIGSAVGIWFVLVGALAAFGAAVWPAVAARVSRPGVVA